MRAFGFEGAPRAAPGVKPSLAIIRKPLEVVGRAVERASSRAASAAAASSALDLGRDLASACAVGQLLWLASRGVGVWGRGRTSRSLRIRR